MRISLGANIIAICLAAVGSQPAAAQKTRVVTTPPEELLAAYVRDNSEFGRPLSEASLNLLGVATGRMDYKHSVDAVLDGLESLALKGATADVRERAAVSLALAGSRDSQRPRSGNVARLERLYAGTSYQGVKAVVVTMLGEAQEASRALGFLEKVATKPDEDFPGASIAAMTAIAGHQDQGGAVLKRLHDSHAIRDPHAVQWLNLIAERGYRIR